MNEVGGCGDLIGSLPVRKGRNWGWGFDREVYEGEGYGNCYYCYCNSIDLKMIFC